MVRTPVLLVLLGIGCGGTSEYSACDELCVELVRNCQYDAFPTTESCLTGCALDAENGADVAAHSDCIVDADCDTFAIIECQNSFGPTP